MTGDRIAVPICFGRIGLPGVFVSLQKTPMPESTPIRINPLSDWLPSAPGPLVIAGPCSVESPEQLRETASALAASGKVQVLRAGVWKPRSRPGEFEGLGSQALPWLIDIRKETGLPIAVEVARPDHVEICLEYGIDILWMGARTTVNPFMVQEIANAIRGSGIPVMVKNPVSPDLKLWAGAIERIFLAGTSYIMAIHRGFKTHEKTIYRNIPLWDIPLALRMEFPGLPVICDPSHIAGHRRWLAEVTVMAMMLQMDGLMVEVHHDPANALTDPQQQITPAALIGLLDNLPGMDPAGDPRQKLSSLRHSIDRHDHRLLELLAGRMQKAWEIGRIKRLHSEAIRQPVRQKDIVDDRVDKGSQLGLDPEFVKKLLHLLHEESINVQSGKYPPAASSATSNKH